jgi:hypothetical protein
MGGHWNDYRPDGWQHYYRSGVFVRDYASGTVIDHLFRIYRVWTSARVPSLFPDAHILQACAWMAESQPVF